MKIKTLFSIKPIILLALILFQSCVSKKQLLYLQDLDHSNYNDVVYDDYLIQVDDILKILVSTTIQQEASMPYNLPQNSQVNGIEVMKLNGYLVSKDRTINFPELGLISVNNKTIKDLERYIKKLLIDGNHLINPTINIRLLNAKVTILGEVNSPGTYNFTEQNFSLLQALGLAGDLNINGSRQDILILSRYNGKQSSVRIDLTSSKWINGPNLMIKPNDVIIVNPNSAKVKSAGLIGNISTVLSIASILLSTIILIR